MSDSQILAPLNKDQKLAAGHDKGPLLIIAGAGTGKTKVITSRILHLMLEKGVSADQILALTFTEKAAQEMIERVDLAMPLGYEEVYIRTFHGFCDMVLKESGMEIGLDPSYRLISSLDACLLLRKNLFKFSLDYYRPLGNPNKFLFSLLNHFSRLKDEDILPSRYLQYAQKLVDEAKEDDDKENAAKTLEIATFYNQYQNFIRQQGCLDFADLIFYTLRLLEKRPSVLKKYQERFKYVMVDEFQDTNYAQSKLVHMLAAGHKNIVAVGDDDQAIYKWRGASLSNILQFEAKYSETKKVVLTQNYRSLQPVLDVAYEVIQNNNPYRLEVQEKLDKKLHSQSNEEMKVQILHAGHFQDEVKAVVDEIEMLVGDGAKLEDCAILARTNSHLQPYVKELTQRGIPYSVSQTQGFFRAGVMKDVLALLQFLKNPYDDVALIRLFSFPGFEIPFSEVLEVSQLAKNKQQQLWKYVKATSDQTQLPLPEVERMKDAVAILKDLLDRRGRNSVGVTLNEFFLQTGYLKGLAEGGSEEQVKQIDYLQRFSQLVADFELEHDPESIDEFLEYIGLLEGSGSVPGSVEERSVSGVQLLTTHGSKGLEFPNVFVVSLVQNRFPSINRRDPFEVPEELVDEPLPTDKGVHLMEERRLFYVACTRAKARLYLSYSDKYEGSRKWKPSIFVEESRESRHVETREVLPTKMIEEVKKKYVAQYPGERLQKTFPKKASFSQFSSFQRCPQQYRFRYLLRLPSPSSHAANFGSSIHNTLNAFYLTLQRGETVSLDLMRELYEKYWISGGYESIAHHNARRKRGWEILENFYAVNSQPFVVPAFLERGFTLKTDLGDVTGRIDRIDKLDDGTYEVIDYKTGTSKKGAKLDKDLQLSLYGLAARDLFGLKVSQLSLYFLEDNQKVSTTRSDEQLNQCADELKELFDEIRSSEFAPDPGFACSFCDYRQICDAAQ